jgi:hypothetical protein
VQRGHENGDYKGCTGKPSSPKLCISADFQVTFLTQDILGAS